MLLYLLSNSCSSKRTWVSALRCTLPVKFNEILLANVLPRNGMKIFQRQLEAFLKDSSNRYGWLVKREIPGLIIPVIAMITDEYWLHASCSVMHTTTLVLPTTLQVDIITLF